jgi:hypothetical protein
MTRQIQGSFAKSLTVKTRHVRILFFPLVALQLLMVYSCHISIPTSSCIIMQIQTVKPHSYLTLIPAKLDFVVVLLEIWCWLLQGLNAVGPPGQTPQITWVPWLSLNLVNLATSGIRLQPWMYLVWNLSARFISKLYLTIRTATTFAATHVTTTTDSTAFLEGPLESL